ncbi:phage tail tip protein J-related protein, partial [Escherichia coli]|uniref:phage tail tip protein J-related protein n=1 Tax=Escherichia coli TaxID=562 RepID=UPI001ADA2D9C
QEKIAGYQYVLANPGWTTDNGFMINHMTSVKTVTEGLTDIRQVETTARYLGAGLYWIAASINIKPGHDYYFYI